MNDTNQNQSSPVPEVDTLTDSDEQSTNPQVTDVPVTGTSAQPVMPNQMVTNQYHPVQAQPMLRLTGDTNDSQERESRFPSRPSGKQAFVQAIKTCLWWVFLPMMMIGGLAGTLLGCAAYWIATGSSGLSVTPNTHANTMQTDVTAVMPQVQVAPGLLTTATIFSLVATGISSIVFFLWKWRSRAPWAEGSLSLRTKGKHIVWGYILAGIIIGVGFYFAYTCIASFMQHVTGLNGSSDTSMTVITMIKSSLAMGTPLGVLAVVLIVLFVSIVNPIGEEFIFRGMIGRGIVDSAMLRKDDGTRAWWQSLLVCLLSGLFFGAVHFTGFTFAGILPVFIMTIFGALLTWLSSIRTRSLLASIGTHVAFNGLQMILLLIVL